ncbi:MAG: 50S ribosomal protein L4 [Candidatus Omnitrophica bacterium]|nr:50S ribosomal protein L4 [Candidatus Omnitrophota bacterium]
MKSNKENPRKAKARKIKTNIEKAKTESPKSKKDGEFSIPVYDMKGKEVEQLKLDKNLFNGEVNKEVLYHAIVVYNSNQRQGNASTKTRGDVSGGGKKPYRQKGTGQARAGSTRSPLWRHGGSIFGPHTRDFHRELPKKVKRLAFLSSINSKLNDEKLVGISAVEIAEAKTKQFKSVVDALKLEGKSLFILDAVDPKVKIASRNLQEVSVKNYKDFNTIDVLKCDNMVISKAALKKLPERFKV